MGFGVVTGLAVWSIAAALGLAALLRTSEPAFVVVKLIGAACLVFLGTQALYSPFTRKRGESSENRDVSRRQITTSRAFRQGVTSNLGNPKIAVFFTSFLPQFTAHGKANFLTMLFLGALFCALTLIWPAGYASVIPRAGDLLRRPRIRRILEGLTGTVLLAFGLRLATEHR